VTATPRYRFAIFDFDGTLANSYPFFAQTFDALADRYRFRRLGAEELPSLRQRHPRDVMKHVGMSSWKLPFVARSFVRLMRKSASSIAPFDGVAEVLGFLAASGVRLAILTSNSRENVSTILGPRTAQFERIECGSSIFGKARRLRAILRTSGVPADEAIYIGDQLADLDAAREAGIAFGAVAWGYGDISAMRAAQEAFLKVEDLRRIALPTPR
jgi:phosphoglycolate phosphatase